MVFTIISLSLNKIMSCFFISQILNPLIVWEAARGFLPILMSFVAQNHLPDFFSLLWSTSNCWDLSCGLCRWHLLVHYVFSICIPAALFILREGSVQSKVKVLSRNRRERGKCGRQKRLCMREGVWTVKCRKGSGVKLRARVWVWVCVSVSQSVGLLLPHHGGSLCRCPALACEFF